MWVLIDLPRIPDLLLCVSVPEADSFFVVTTTGKLYEVVLAPEPGTHLRAERGFDVCSAGVSTLTWVGREVPLLGPGDCDPPDDIWGRRVADPSPSGERLEVDYEEGVVRVIRFDGLLREEIGVRIDWVDLFGFQSPTWVIARFSPDGRYLIVMDKYDLQAFRREDEPEEVPAHSGVECNLELPAPFPVSPPPAPPPPVPPIEATPLDAGGWRGRRRGRLRSRLDLHREMEVNLAEKQQRSEEAEEEDAEGDRNEPDPHTRAGFYRPGKSVVAVEWWLDDLDVESESWARIREYSDETADLCMGEGQVLRGFRYLGAAQRHLRDRTRSSLREAHDYFLCVRSTSAGEQGSARILGVTHPNWQDRPDQEFRYEW